ncbi:anhydro-N-acetylmuramic acid kinase [Hydrocarboniphaga sp.]|uniref:anhydro-N-acetylmuramic acid kinase n=1 Tax=Hydrocarboniphaga sp. TaxID=2033016 RepID=UPI003D134403
MRAIGLISGTSQDGIDAVLAEFEHGQFQRLLATHSGAYPPAIRSRLLELGYEASPVTLAEYAALDRAVADAFADTAIELLRIAGVDHAAVNVLGSHGQTVFHDAVGIANSLQLGDPSRIAVRSRIVTVADFRRADVALGGQGAPLLPVFHHALFAEDGRPAAVLNLGGIANLTLLPSADAAAVRGFDCGPANGLMDEWAELHTGARYDADGAFAASGKVHVPLLEALLADPYFALPAPKSTGRGYFRLAWVRALWPTLDQLPAADVQRTLCELTARSALQALQAAMPEARELLVCGGGVRNRFLMQRLRALAPQLRVESTEARGLHPDWVEATAFAWLAVQRLDGCAGNLPGVTGASRAAVLGGVFDP